MATSNRLKAETEHLMRPAQPIEFVDLKAQQARIRPALDAAIRRVLDHGQYIMGPEVKTLERDLAAFSGDVTVRPVGNRRADEQCQPEQLLWNAQPIARELGEQDYHKQRHYEDSR